MIGVQTLNINMLNINAFYQALNMTATIQVLYSNKEIHAPEPMIGPSPSLDIYVTSLVVKMSLV